MWITERLRAIIFSKRRLAWLVAMAADAIQIIALPVFSEGVWSPLDTALDLVAAAVLIKLLGWHWAFLPTFFAELVPALDLFPTWTAAVFYVTRQGARTHEPEIIPPTSATTHRS